MELEENLSYQRELLYVILREATYEVPQDVLAQRLEFLLNFPFQKDTGTEKGSVTLEKMSYQHELPYAILLEGIREVQQEFRRGLASRGEFQRGSVALEQNLSFQHELMYEILREAMREVPQDVRPGL